MFSPRSKLKLKVLFTFSYIFIEQMFSDYPQCSILQTPEEKKNNNKGI